MKVLWPEFKNILANFYDRSATIDKIKNDCKHENIYSLKQVHGNKVILVDDLILSNPALKNSNPPPLGEGDGLITKNPNVALVVHTADCIPLLATDGNWIGACHAGWRGVQSGVIESWISQLKKYSTNFKNIKIMLGPAIQSCHFEVGLDVAEQLKKTSFGELPKKVLEKTHLPHKDPKKMFIDLKTIAGFILLKAGVVPQNISSIDACTFCESEKYFSYRRDGAKAGRLEAVIQKST